MTDEQLLNQAVDKQGRINDRKLFNLLYPNSKSNRFKSAITPAAQSATPCEVPDIPEDIIQELETLRIRLAKENRLLWYIIELQMLGGCRITEVLGIAPLDITKLGQVRIRGLKGSQDSVIVPHDSKTYLLKCKSNAVYPFAGISRFYVYREYKKLGLSYRFQGKSKQSVTHLFRQLNARVMESENFDHSLIQKSLNHKSKDSTNHYLSHERTGK